MLEELEAGPAHPASGAGGSCTGVAQEVPLQPQGCGTGCPSPGPVCSCTSPSCHTGSRGSPCLSLQTSFQFIGELSKQSGTINGKDSLCALGLILQGGNNTLSARLGWQQK